MPASAGPDTTSSEWATPCRWAPPAALPAGNTIQSDRCGADVRGIALHVRSIVTVAGCRRSDVRRPCGSGQPGAGPCARELAGSRQARVRRPCRRARAVSGLLALRPKASTRLASSCPDHTPSYSMSPMVIVADWWSGGRSAVQRLFGPAPSHASCAAHRRWPETPSLSLRQPAGVAWLHPTPTHPCTPAALLAMQ